jgi:TRAP-type C4-dicarboxylate transport system permease small subunit
MQGAPAHEEEKPSITTVVGKTPAFSTKQTTMMDVISTVLFIGFSAVAIYYGWVLGRQNGPYFWSVIQSIGSTIRSYLVRLITYAQEYARRSR